MQEVRLRKKGERKGERLDIIQALHERHVHGVRDYRKVLNFVVDKGWIDKTPICTGERGNCENLCTGFCPGSSGRCIYQVSGVYRTECTRGEL